MKRTDTAAVRERLEGLKLRSAWARGVREYAYELLDRIDEIGEELDNDAEITQKFVLNGAANWAQYSEGGCSLIYNDDIAQRLCAPWELKRMTKHGRALRDPNKCETWIDVQARALCQAWKMICENN